MIATLEHDALIYRSEDEYLETLVPFLQEGLEAGAGCVVATKDENRDALMRALGPSAERVVFVPSSEVYASTHSALAAYRRALDQFRAAGLSWVRAVGEVAYPDGDLREWLRYEPIAHGVFEQSPLHVICPYDARTLPAPLIEHAARTHPALHEAGARGRNAAFEEPIGLLRTLPRVNVPPPTGDPDLAMVVRLGSAHHARASVASLLSEHLSEERVSTALVAVNETIENGLRHGNGDVRARVWAGPAAVVCEIGNDGPPIEDPYAGYRPTSDPERGGMGLWLACQFADDLAISHDARGPIVRLTFLP